MWVVQETPKLCQATVLAIVALLGKYSFPSDEVQQAHEVLLTEKSAP